MVETTAARQALPDMLMSLFEAQMGPKQLLKDFLGFVADPVA